MEGFAAIAADAIEAQLRGAGMGAGPAASKAAMLARIHQGFDGTGPARAWFVPGRIEVLGKHTDYAGGRCLLAAVERGFCLIAAPRADRLVRLHDVDWQSRVEFELGDVPDAAANWARYPAAVARRLAQDFTQPWRGVDIALASDLPRAAGMSSSSALLVASLLAFAAANDLESGERFRRHLADRESLAAYAAAIESGRAYGPFAAHVGVGTYGGSEDHTAILCCRPGELAVYSFCPTRRERSVALPPDVTFVIAVSGVAASKAHAVRDDYNRLARLPAAIVDRYNQTASTAVEYLAAIDSDIPALETALAAQSTGEFTGAELHARWRQFRHEQHAALTVPDALVRNDWAAIGTCIDLSQAMAEADLGNQVEETVYLQSSARRLGALAASSFGAGFGGSVWALVPTAQAKTFKDAWKADYVESFPVHAPQSQFFRTGAGPAALELKIS
ncbi:MAG TPA: galactokinase family protein [Terriglobales bacterium]|nr:galactokinase family protein [Terriglobales bacterium]